MCTERQDCSEQITSPFTVSHYNNYRYSLRNIDIRPDRSCLRFKDRLEIGGSHQLCKGGRCYYPKYSDVMRDYRHGLPLSGEIMDERQLQQLLQITEVRDDVS